MSFTKCIEKLMFYFIYVYIILFAILPSKFIFFGISFSDDLLLTIIILCYIINIFFGTEARKKFIIGLKNFFKDSLSLTIFIVIALMFVSTTYSISKTTALNESLRFSTYIILYFIIKYHSTDKKVIDNIMRCYIFVVAIVSSFGIIEYASGKTDMVRISKLGVTKRIASTLENPNNLGVFLIFAIFPLLILCIHEKVKKKKIVYCLCLILVLINIILTGSRNAWLGLAVGLILLIFIYNKKLFIGITVLGAMALFLPQVARIFKVFSDITFNENRIKAWKLSLLIIKDHPLKGIGIGNFKFVYKTYMNKYPNLTIYDESLLHPHNAFLKIFTEVGSIAGILFILFFIILIVKMIKFLGQGKSDFYNYFYEGFTVSLIIFILMNTVDSFLSAPKVLAYFWILIATAQAMEYINDSKYLA